MNDSIIVELQKQLSKFGLWNTLLDLCGLKFRTADNKVFAIACSCNSTGAKPIAFITTSRTADWNCGGCKASKNGKSFVDLVCHLRKNFSVSDVVEIATAVVSEHVKAMTDEATRLAKKLEAYGAYTLNVNTQKN